MSSNRPLFPRNNITKQTDELIFVLRTKKTPKELIENKWKNLTNSAEILIVGYL